MNNPCKNGKMEKFSKLLSTLSLPVPAVLFPETEHLSYREFGKAHHSY